MIEVSDRQEIGRDEKPAPAEAFRSVWKRIRRRELRYPAEGPVTVRPVHGGRVEDLPGELLDVSRSGLRVRLNRELRLKTLVAIKLGGGTLLGEVRQCRRVGAGFEAGVWIAGVNWKAVEQEVAGRADPSVKLVDACP